MNASNCRCGKPGSFLIRGVNYCDFCLPEKAVSASELSDRDKQMIQAYKDLFGGDWSGLG